MTGEEFVKRQDLHPLWDIKREPMAEDVEDAFNQGLNEGRKELLDKAWSEQTIRDWYIDSVDTTSEPKWTDAHIEELCKDFILIKKEDEQ